MSSMVQGDAYSLDVTIKNNGSPINISDVRTVEFTLFNFKKIIRGTRNTRTESSTFPSPSRRPFGSRRSVRCRCA